MPPLDAPGTPAAAPSAPAVSTTEATNAKMLTQTVGKLVEVLGTGNVDVVAAIEAITAAVTAALVGTARTLTAGAGLTGGGDLSTDRTFDVGAGTGILVNADDVAVDKASDANVRAAASNKVLTADHIESASAVATLTDAATIALDWDTGINFGVTLTTDRILGNPTNGQPGTWRTVLVKSDGGPDALTFDSQYGGAPPTIDDVTTTQFYLLMVFCKTSTQFLVSSIDGSDA